ncbi:tetratricopeptide repeat protein [Alkalimarinus sediminis]|uniref:Tetratricopeptide repeat protein n=1 Tax=Alkalimarinus sediminis TaxID=1632866 RepID=A0A9E8HI55_9ALTE|nr:tetratricopeptide repeat protein [Alkalimarinus sediminis]UZW74627.1 tetratricopeptide repeat protein [Alkalimarinus sediminis]
MSPTFTLLWQRFSVHLKATLALILCCSSVNVSANSAIIDNFSPRVKAHEAYVGSATCGQCHQAELQQWQASHHAKAMMEPTADNVLGDFNNQEVTFDDVKTIFSQREDGYFITTQNGAKKTETFKVAFTFGYTPLQQYLINIGDGKLQAFDVAWDARAKSEGGQRWFKLLPDEDTTPESPFHWTRQTQNWNSRCADCHSTNLNKGYNPVYQRYDTTFTELNVACESCHGAGKSHVSLINSGGYKKGVNSGFKTDLKQTRQFIFDGSNPIAQPKGEATSAQIDACGGCHSRRQVIGEIDPADDYHNQYSLRLIDTALYHSDGQIKDEVFVLGSFLQSKMHQAGVTCTDCHNAHTGEVKAQDNTLCTQCHVAERYDSQKHHHHKASSEGALCINCHMPTTTYMEVDDRRDHSFSTPAPQHSDAMDTPNACNSCHRIQSNQWSADAIEKWTTQAQPDPFAVINSRAINADVLALRGMTEYVADEQYPAIRRATLLSLTGTIPSRLTAETISQQLSSSSPLVRRAAVEASAFIPLQHRWGLLKPLMTDPSASVRFAVANQLAGYAAQVSGDDYVTLSKLLREYEKQLRLSQDMPAGQAAIAMYALNQGDTEGALTALNKALEIEPDYAPALLNLADLYRGMGDESEALNILKRAIAVAPDSGAIQHSFGLYWIRQGQLEKALSYLKAATEQDDSVVRYAYVYGVALESAGQLESAIKILEAANEQWPNQYDLLFSLILYLEKAGRVSESWPYLSNLSAIAPNDPEVKRRLANMRRDK